MRGFTEEEKRKLSKKIQEERAERHEKILESARISDEMDERFGKIGRLIKYLIWFFGN